MTAECPGLYRHAAAADGFVGRVRLPGGRIAAQAAQAIGAAAEVFGNGIVELTGRGNLQIRGLRAGEDRLPAHLEPFGLCPDDPAADRRRNVLADPLAGLADGDAADISPLVASLYRALGRKRSLLDGISPKVSFVLDGGGSWASLAFPHDFGVRAEKSADGPIFRISLAGRTLRLGIRAEHVVAVLIALAEAAARRHPAGRGRALFAGDVAGHVEAATGTRPLTLPDARFTAEPPGLVGQFQTSSGVAFGFAVPGGAIGASELRRLADLAADFGDGRLHLTPRRSVLLTGLAPAGLGSLAREAEKIGLLARPTPVATIACSGRACARGRADARRDAASLAAALSDLPMRDRQPVVHVSGCPRGCSHPGAADVVLVAASTGLYDLHRSARADASGSPLFCNLPPERLAEAAREALAMTSIPAGPVPSHDGLHP